MSGRPTLKVYLDDGTGTFPYDITSYVDLNTADMTITRGRADELSTVQPGTLSICLNNADGRFTYGSSQYSCAIDQKIKVTEQVSTTTVTRFTGYVQSWPTQFSNGGTYATATIQAADRQAKLSRRVLRTILGEEILYRNAVAYYPMGEPEKSTTLGNISTTVLPTMTLQDSTGTALAVGATNIVPTDSQTCVKFGGNGTTTTAQYFAAQAPSPFITALSGSWSIFCCAIPTHDGVLFGTQHGNGGNGCWLYVQSGNMVALVNGFGSGVTGTVTVTDGALHTGLVTFDGTTMKLYVDGNLVGSNAPGAGFIPTDSCDTVSAGNVWISPGFEQISGSGSVAHCAVFASALTATDATALDTAARTGFFGEQSDTRISRLLGYADVATSDMNLDAGVQPVAYSDFVGSSPQEAIQNVVDAENGVVFVQGDGKYAFHNRNHRIGAAVAAALSGDDVDPSINYVVDTTYLVNYATASRVNGATQVAQATTSINEHDMYSKDFQDLLVTTDESAMDRASWAVYAYAEPDPRLPDVTVDLFTATTSIQTAMLQVDVSSRITVGPLPSQSPQSTADVIVEGFTETLNNDSWTLKINASSTSSIPWKLGDSTYGVLGTSTRLYF